MTNSLEESLEILRQINHREIGHKTDEISELQKRVYSNALNMAYVTGYLHAALGLPSQSPYDINSQEK